MSLGIRRIGGATGPRRFRGPISPGPTRGGTSRVSRLPCSSVSSRKRGPEEVATAGRGAARKRRDPIADGPRLFRRGRWWAVDLRPWGGARPTLRDPAHPKGERTEFKDVARAWAEAWVAKLTRQTHDRQRGIKPRRPLKAAVEEYLRHRQSTVERNTWTSDTTALGHLQEAFGEKRDVHTISQEELQAWFNDRASTYSPTTLQTYRAHMQGFFGWLGRPIERIELLKRNQEDPDALTDAEIAEVLSACRTERESIVIRTALATGTRKAELWALEWSDFRADRRSVRVQRQIAWPGTTTKGLKGKRARSTLVLPGFMDTLTWGTSGRVVPGWVVSNESADDVVQRVLKRAGAYKVGRGSHVFRHTFARIGLEQYEWSLEMLMIFLGHTSVKTTEIYKHFGEETAIRLAERRTYPKDLISRTDK